MVPPGLSALCSSLTDPEAIKSLIVNNQFDLSERPPGLDMFFTTDRYMADHRGLQDYSWVYAIRESLRAAREDYWRCIPRYGSVRNQKKQKEGHLDLLASSIAGKFRDMKTTVHRRINENLYCDAMKKFRWLDCEAITQDAHLAFCKRVLPSLRDETTATDLRCLLSGITRRTGLRASRDRQRRQAHESTSDDLEAVVHAQAMAGRDYRRNHAQAAEVHATQNEECRLIGEALEHINARYRECLLLRSQGWEYEDIAAECGISIASLHVLVHRAREQLRKVLQKRGETLS
jgi:RNA polymerase sigma factor (sigma-70 family)